jgi:hypothetical protein
MGGSVARIARRRGAREAALIATLYLASELSRGIASGGTALAEQHATTVVNLERSLHVFDEASVQRLVHHVPGLPALLGYAYLTLHLTATALVLAWVYRHHHHAYRTLRNTLAVASAIAIVGYWLFPTAPPRLAGVGIADTVSGATSINLTSHLVSSFYNPYAAVPSMHIGFALLIGVTVARLARRRSVRIAGALYPLFVLLVIVATGNHFFLDAAAGAAVAAIAAATVALARLAYSGSTPGGARSSMPYRAAASATRAISGCLSAGGYPSAVAASLASCTKPANPAGLPTPSHPASSLSTQ